MTTDVNGSLVGAAGADTVTGTSGNDTINLTLYGGAGNDKLYGGDGNDRVISDGGDTLYGGSGSDILDLRLQSSTIGYSINIANELAVSAIPGGMYDIGDGHTFVNSFEQLFFYGGSGADNVVGGALNDILDGGSGQDSLYGGGGNDSLVGHNGTAVLDGGVGNDTITINGFVSQVEGGDGFDKLYITGLAGYDAAGHVGAIHGVEQIFVTAGLGPITFSHDTDPQTIDHYSAAAGGLANDTYGHQIYVTDVSDGHGGFLGATITGSQYGDTISGGSGGDHLIGASGNDTLYGGAGNDTLEGGVGGDHLFGGAGDDTVLIYSGPNQQPDATVDGGDGTDTLFYNAHYATAGVAIDITAATTTPLGTTITGFEVLNYTGGDFGDTVHGGALNDTIYGGAGDDFLFGGAGVNQLIGNGGNDTAVFIGQSSDFTFAHQGTWIVATDTVTGETDYLNSIENVSFNNGTDTHLLTDFIH